MRLGCGHLCQMLRQEKWIMGLLFLALVVPLAPFHGLLR